MGILFAAGAGGAAAGAGHGGRMAAGEAFRRIHVGADAQGEFTYEIQ